MKLDPNALRYLTRDDFRVLTAVEMGQKNHEIVPVELVTQIAALRLGGVAKILSTLLRNKLLHHDRSSFDGYRLTNLGFDYLALRTFLARESISGVGRQIGVGKESDIFTVANEEGEEFCLKLHRLGRTSFRAIKNKRDYHKSRGSPSWLYLSRLAAIKENTFMKVLKEHGFPVPTPIDGNRHAIVMSLVNGFPLNQVRILDDPEQIYVQMMELIERFARHGLIHGDFNEFNVMIDEKGTLTVIDFPQMVSINHPNARMYFERDVNCVRRFFRKRFNFFHEMRPDFDACSSERVAELDRLVAASGFSYEMAKEFDRFIEHKPEANDSEESSGEDESGQDDDCDDEEGDDQAGAGDEGDEGDEGDQAGAALVDEAPAPAPVPAPAPTLASVAAEAGAQEAGAQEAGAQEAAQAAAEADGAEADGAEAQAADSDDVDEASSLGDGPQAYMAHDFASQSGSRAAPRVDDVRRRVQRDLQRKTRKGGASKLKRNTNKSKDKRRLANEVKGF